VKRPLGTTLDDNPNMVLWNPYPSPKPAALVPIPRLGGFAIHAADVGSAQGSYPTSRFDGEDELKLWPV